MLHGSDEKLDTKRYSHSVFGVIRLMAKFSEHYSPGIETGEGEGLSKMTEN